LLMSPEYVVRVIVSIVIRFVSFLHLFFLINASPSI
jgi:hypothetical protein